MRCLCCHRDLVPGEEVVCLECQMHFPVVNCCDAQNPLWARLAGMFPFEHATMLAYYQHGNEFATLVRRAKFGAKPRINAYLTEMLLTQLEESGWPYDIDLIVPVPIHWTKYLTRGYNQVSPITHVLAEHWHIPEETGCLTRQRLSRSQLRVREQSRSDVSEGVFRLQHPERLAGHHILLVDDVCTTGATITSCASLLQTLPEVRISVLTLGMTLSV